MTPNRSLTPYPDVNAVLDVLLAHVQTILGDRFAGLYLYGSLAGGDFDLQRSDIDFVVVTTEALPEAMMPALEAMRARLAASGLKRAMKLEGAYIPQSGLRRYDPTAPPRPTINEGRFYLAREGSDWVIQRHILREQGVVVAGPPPHTLIDPVQPDDIRQAVQAILREWWSPMLGDPDRLRRREYQAYAVLTMCRAHYALRFGRIVSKPVAARWAQIALTERWAALIDRALAWPHEPQPDEMSETLDFIRDTIEHGQSRSTPT